MSDTLHIKSNCNWKTYHSYQLIKTRKSLCIDNQCYNIKQSSTIKVLLRHLKRRYIVISIKNHADSINVMHFLFDKFPYLSHLLTLVSKGCVQTNHLNNLLCRYCSRLHLKRARQNHWSCHSSGSWKLDKTIHLDHATIVWFHNLLGGSISSFSKLCTTSIATI